MPFSFFEIVMIILCPHPGSSIMFLEASAAISGEAKDLDLW
jgi:hypothetical protein